MISNRNKVSLLSDKLIHENNIGRALTETWLNSDISDAEFQIKGYSLFRADRSRPCRGGPLVI